MLDCPEQSHTSPTTTSWMTISRISLATVSVRGSVEAFNADNVTCHRPSPAVVACRVCLPNVTRICSPGDAVPQTGIGISRCSTAPSANRLAKRSSLAFSDVAKTNIGNNRRRLRISDLNLRTPWESSRTNGSTSAFSLAHSVKLMNTSTNRREFIAGSAGIAATSLLPVQLTAQNVGGLRLARFRYDVTPPKISALRRLDQTGGRRG